MYFTSIARPVARYPPLTSYQSCAEFRARCETERVSVHYQTLAPRPPELPPAKLLVHLIEYRVRGSGEAVADVALQPPPGSGGGTTGADAVRLNMA